MGSSGNVTSSRATRRSHPDNFRAANCAWVGTLLGLPHLSLPEEPSMPKVKQLTVTCSNRPGTLAHVANVLGDAHVNIQGFLLRTSGPKGFVQLLVNNVPRAKKALNRAGIEYTEETVLVANIPNAPRALGRFAARLASGAGGSRRRPFKRWPFCG